MDFWTRHIPDEILTDYAARIAASVRWTVDIQSHLQECRRCAKQLATLTKIFALMQSDKASDVAPEMRHWASQVFRTRQTAQAVSGGVRKTLQALLRMELSPFAPAMGERSGPGLERQMLYHAGSYELDLRLTPHGVQWEVAGQILGPCESGEVFLQGSAGEVQATLNPLAEFVLPFVPAGAYKLLVHCDEVLLEVPELSLTEH